MQHNAAECSACLLVRLIVWLVLACVCAQAHVHAALANAQFAAEACVYAYVFICVCMQSSFTHTNLKHLYKHLCIHICMPVAHLFGLLILELLVCMQGEV